MGTEVRCPRCAELIQPEATECNHCGEWLGLVRRIRMIQRTETTIARRRVLLAARIKQRLLRKSRPRFQATLILVFTALAGFLTSYTLLHLHLFSMWLRYPVAILISYGVFLLLLRVWLWTHGRRINADVHRSVFDFIPSPDRVTGGSFHGGGGGDFGGGGAGGSWGQSVASSSSEAASNGIGSDLDLGELWLIILAVIAIPAGLLASLYIVYIAPTLLAEILIDGVLMVGLYRRVKHIEHRYWLRTALRQTLLPALLAALFFGAAGLTLQKAVPEAHSIGDVWKQIR